MALNSFTGESQSDTDATLSTIAFTFLISWLSFTKTIVTTMSVAIITTESSTTVMVKSVTRVLISTLLLLKLFCFCIDVCVVHQCLYISIILTKMQ